MREISAIDEEGKTKRITKNKDKTKQNKTKPIERNSRDGNESLTIKAGKHQQVSDWSEKTMAK